MKNFIICLLILTAILAKPSQVMASSFYKYKMPEKIAQFKGVVITQEEFGNRLIDIISKPEFSAAVSSSFVRSTVIEMNLRKNMINISEKDLMKKRNEIIKLAGGMEKFKQSLISTNMSWYSIDAMVKDALGLEILTRELENITADKKVPPEALNKTLRKILKAYKNPHFLGTRKPCVITLGGIDLMQSDFRNFLYSHCDKKFLSAVLDGLISDKRILAEAENMQVIPNTLDEQKLISEKNEDLKRQSLAQGLLKPVTFEQYLAGQGLTIEAYKKKTDFRAQLATVKILQKELTNKTLEKYYNDNKSEYMILYVYQLFFPFNKENPYKTIKPTEEIKNRTIAIVAAVNKKLKTFVKGSINIKTFESLAGSIDGCNFEKIGYICRSRELKFKLKPSAYNLDYDKNIYNRKVSPIKYPHPVFVKMAYQLHNGQISKIFMTEFGYHFVLRAGERYPKNWKAVKDIIYDKMFRIKGKELLQLLDKKYPVTYYWKFVI